MLLVLKNCIACIQLISHPGHQSYSPLPPCTPTPQLSVHAVPIPQTFIYLHNRCPYADAFLEYSLALDVDQSSAYCAQLEKQNVAEYIYLANSLAAIVLQGGTLLIAAFVLANALLKYAPLHHTLRVASTL